jgi:serine/threonine protein kinase
MSEFIGKVLADKYRVESVMRESGMGTIFRGSHLLMDKPVAIKILSPALAVDDNIVQRFSVEARTVSRLSHPNVLNITDYGTDKNDVVFIVMEYAEGETLKHAIAEDGKFSLERAGNIINQIASALSTAHAQGIIHRNLNSENILLTTTPTEKDLVKILDFGTVRIDESDISDRKPEYLSPEQCSESSEADERSDIYSLGVILYEMLAGEVPFVADTPTDVMLKHVQEPPPPILSVRNDLPTEVENIVQRALAKQPVQRFQSATDLSDALKRIGTNNFYEVEQETVVNPKIEEEVPIQPQIVAKPFPQPQNNLWKTAFIVLAGICALGVGLVFMTNGKRTNPELQTDVNGIPVQPVNPATGMTEQSSANYNSATGQYGVNAIDPGVQVVGDSNPLWDRGGRPPAGAPVGGGVPYPVVPQTGVTQQTYQANGMPTVDGNSQFTTDYELRAINANANAKTVKNANVNVKVNSNVPIKPNTNANVKVVPPNANTTTTNTTTPTVPPANTAKPTKPIKGKPPIKVVPTPKVEKPVETPKIDKPPTSNKTTPSGKESDAQ